MSTPLSRREFLANSALTATALGFGLRANAAESTTAKRWPIITFSKPFQQLSATETAEFVALVGWDGIECPVRPKGQIEPERAMDELPKLTAALRKLGKDVYIATTSLTSMTQPHAETVLRAVAQAGVKRIRLGYWKYDLNRSPADQLKEFAPAIKDIAAACGELGIQAGYQNHSGRDYVGGPVWDIYSLIRDLDPKTMGMCFDIGHATIEGGLDWRIQAKLIEPFYTAVFVKDFTWQKNDTGWRAQWCPLGEGQVSPTFFADLKKSNYSGPISQHHEYALGDREKMIAHFRRDLDVLRGWIA